jgi:hypothetical protein
MFSAAVSPPRVSYLSDRNLHQRERVRIDLSEVSS